MADGRADGSPFVGMLSTDWSTLRMLTTIRPRALVSVCALVIAVSATALSAQTAPPPASSVPPATAARAPAPADTAAPGGRGRALFAACRADLDTHCAGVERGGGRKIQCLKANEAKLGADCRNAIATVVAQVNERRDGHRMERQALRQQCAGDIAKLCATVAPAAGQPGEKGHGGVGKCLRENAAALSAPCRGALDEMQARAREVRQAVRQACAADAGTLCGTAARPREAMMCLRQRQAEATPGCREALAKLPMGGHHQAGSQAGGPAGE